MQPGEDYVWEMQFTAPNKPGKYEAYFRLETGHSVRFGHKVWCNFLVEPVAVQEPEAKPAVDAVVEEEIVAQIGMSIMHAQLSGESIEVPNDEIDALVSSQIVYGDKQVEPEVSNLGKS